MAEICRVAMLYLDADEGKLTMGEATARGGATPEKRRERGEWTCKRQRLR